MHKFKELIVWQKSRELVKDIYLTTLSFPADEKFGLTSQIRRAVVSIHSNIAEGAGRTTNSDFCRFLDIANGSACEIETQLHLALDLGFIDEQNFEKINIKIQNVQKLLFNFRKSLKE